MIKDIQHFSKILFIMHMPPPVHGASMMGKYIHDSKLINRHWQKIYRILGKEVSLNYGVF